MDLPRKDESQHVHLLAKPAGLLERRFAWAAVLVSVGLFLLALPYSALQFSKHPAFLPIYTTSLIISDLITAVMLYGQYYALRARALLYLGAAYLFTAAVTFAYALVFPGLLAPGGLLDSGPQSTSVMYMVWHAGFPLLVMAYTWAKRAPRPVLVPPLPSARGPIVLSVTLVFVAVGAGTLLATQMQEHLPIFLDGDRTTPTGHRVLFSIWLLSVAALALLGFSRPHSALDVWLLVVMCVWVLDVAMAAVFNTGRYDLGWYAGRLYGFLAACGLLLVLLSEHARSYAKLVRVSAELRAANDLLWQISMQDGLTQLANRRAFDRYLREQMAVAARQGRSLALVLADVDHFKAYNDFYGHQAGDDCLREVAAALRSCCHRPTDLVARYGGEEFALILPDTSAGGALHVAEAVRTAVLRCGIPHAPSFGAGHHVSVSLGVAVMPPCHGAPVEPLLLAADAALYLAKSRGRNQVVMGEVVDPTESSVPQDESVPGVT